MKITINWLKQLFNRKSKISTQSYGQVLKTTSFYDNTFSTHRHIRVFISSTFKDMKMERELLVKQVFPELRRICADRFVTFTEVDLRWGITEEQAAEGKVLPICLEEIRRCRPYFIGLLGERYGWIPESVPRKVIEREPWLQEHIGNRTSVTELEIIQGVLKNPKMAAHAFFFFRDPGYINSISEEDCINFIAENAEDANKLNKLKERIRRSGFPVLENYADPNALAAEIRKQFLSLIDRLYPEENVPDPLDQEAMGHESYGWNKLMAFVERPAHSEAIDTFVADESQGQGLVVTGESGSGKTALLASWIKHWRVNHPEDYVFVHYFGATQGSASITGFLFRLLGELKRRFGISDEIAGESEKLRDAMPLWLARTKGKGKIIFIFDGLDRIEGDEPDRQLAWLPRFFPKNVRVIVTALPGPPLETLLAREWNEYSLPPIDIKERSQIIKAFFKYYRKTLAPSLISQITEAPGSANLLFLRTILEELRQFGSFKHLPGRVAHYLEARSPDALFRLVLRRWQEDFNARQDLVKHALCCLWAARQGLSEIEWLELLGNPEQPLPRQVWSPLFFAMEPHLSQQSGLWTFSHDFLRHAVIEELMPYVQDRSTEHITIADYFDQRPLDARKVDELPWQLYRAEEWRRLKVCLTDMQIFLELCAEKRQYELTRYWMAMGERYDMVEAYHEMIAQNERATSNSLLLKEVASFLYLNARYEGAEPLFRRALSIQENASGPDHSDTALILNTLADLLRTKGEFVEAEHLLRKALAIQKKVSGPEHPNTASSLNTLAVLLYAKGEFEEAEHLHRQVLTIQEKASGPNHLDTALSLSNLAVLLRAKGNLNEAEHFQRRVLATIEKVLGPDHPDTASSLNNLAVLLDAKGEFEEAEHLQRWALVISEKNLGPDHPHTASSMKNLAVTLYAKGEFEEAELLYRRALDAREKVLGPDHPHTASCMKSLADLLYVKKDFKEAEHLHRRALVIQEKVSGPDHPYTASSLNSLAVLLNAKGDFKEAEKLYRRALTIQEKILGPDHLSSCTTKNNLDRLLVKIRK